ncbi:hypothetical protein [Flavobacterium phage V157]|nr:hypothetical protein [Flavobacterium phage V175]ASD51877.1 hypothetical protein [Flavobacterium phage V181]ASD52775.1 hypothetical protein [Flavobacterium phage V156]ASD52853.1 hypothetical protein [Flavobacterium phage V157]ASD52932.1 hypothetical protein [Flavobacterium phage V165]ASD53011.1 hypothetical protein [Flavobacterium phage V182]QCW20949.1 hypothetical protein [Flavobacterium phage FCOV-F2]QCW21025.1 hypothetical protein [Flavobacterium phage FCOV-F6]QCW21101.1 hypothetical p
MKVIHLKNKEGFFESFHYERISELNPEFKNRNINLNKRGKYGNNLYLGNDTFIKKCKIEDNVVIQDNCNIGYNVKIANNCVINHNSNIGEEVVICDNVTIGNDCLIGRKVIINSSSHILHHSKIGDEVEIIENSLVKKYSIIVRNLCLKNVCSRHKIFFTANSKLCIAYNVFSLDEWLNKGDELLENYCFYDKKEVAEYKAHIETVNMFQNNFETFKHTIVIL